MKLSNSYFFTLRENVKDEDSVSSNLLARAGMIKKLSNGIYIILPMGKRVLAKIENVVREEMDSHGAQELLMPALIPEDVYVSSGRREAFGANMFALKDRYDKNTCLVLRMKNCLRCAQRWTASLERFPVQPVPDPDQIPR